MPAIAILCSGNGSNLQAILNAIRAGHLAASVGIVITDKPDAKALVRAHRFGIEAHFVNPRDFTTRSEYETHLITLLEARRVALVCLAGFMRILSPAFVRHYANRLLNIHPALLPAFTGAHAVRDALAWGVKVTGVTVHFVDEQVDHGPIIVQEAVSVLARDTEKSLLNRIHRVEHRLYPKAIGLVLAGKAAVVGRSVRLQ